MALASTAGGAALECGRTGWGGQGAEGGRRFCFSSVWNAAGDRLLFLSLSLSRKSSIDRIDDSFLGFRRRLRNRCRCCCCFCCCCDSLRVVSVWQRWRGVAKYARNGRFLLNDSTLCSHWSVAPPSPLRRHPPAATSTVGRWPLDAICGRSDYFYCRHYDVAEFDRLCRARGRYF